MIRPNLGSNCLTRLSADATSTKDFMWIHHVDKNSVDPDLLASSSAGFIGSQLIWTYAFFKPGHRILKDICLLGQFQKQQVMKNVPFMFSFQLNFWLQNRSNTQSTKPVIKKSFCYFSTKTYVVGTQKAPSQFKLIDKVLKKIVFTYLVNSC